MAIINDIIKEAYTIAAKNYWNDEYKKHGWKVVHDAGGLEKTLNLAEKEIDFFLFPNKEKCLTLLSDKENNPYPTFNKDFIKHKPITDYLSNLELCTALDYGCGYLSRYSIALSKYFKNVIGVDISSEAINNSRNFVKKQNIKNILSIVNDGLTVPLPKNSVDFIFSNLVLQHIGWSDAFKFIIKEFSRVLKPGGVIRVEHISSAQKKDKDFMSVVEGNGYDEKELCKLYEDNNIKILTITDDLVDYTWITGVKNNV